MITMNNTSLKLNQESHSTIIIVLRTLLVLFISLAIIFSNILNIAILSKLRDLQIVGKIILINLSVADLLNGVFVCMPAVIASANDKWLLGDVYCKCSGIMHGMTCTVSIWCLAIVSADRYIAVNHAVRYRIASKIYICIFILIGIWFAALITFLAPHLNDPEYYTYTPHTVMCGLVWKSPYFCIATGVYIPIFSAVIIFFTSYKVSKVLMAIRDAKLSRSKMTKCNRDAKAIRMLRITTSCYMAAWGPYTLCVYLLAFGAIPYLPEELEFTVSWLANCNSFMNVIIYSGNFEGFSKHLKGYFSCCMFSCCRKDNSVQPDTTQEESVMPSTISQTNIY